MKGDENSFFRCLCNRTTLHFDFFHSFFVRKPLFFRCIGELMTNQWKCHFSPVFTSFLLAVWFCTYTHAQLRILKFAVRFAHRPWKTSKRSVATQTNSKEIPYGISLSVFFSFFRWRVNLITKKGETANS